MTLMPRLITMRSFLLCNFFVIFMVLTMAVADFYLFYTRVRKVGTCQIARG